MSSNKPLVHTTENLAKEVINNMKTEKPQEYQTKKDKYISNEPKKGMALNKSSSLDNSGASQRTETEYTVKPLKKQGIYHQLVTRTKKIKINTNGIISIICTCNHC